MNITKIEINIFMNSESKIDNSCPIYTMKGYSIPSRLDWASHWVECFCFVREDIPCKTIKIDCDADFDGFFGGDKFKKEKMVIVMF